MKRLLRAGPILATAALILAGVAGAAGGDVLVTVGSPTAPFSQNKQNEPAVAVNPIAPNIVAAGVNEEVDMEACNNRADTTCPFTPGVGTSGVYFSDTGGSRWIQPEDTGWTAGGRPGRVGTSTAPADNCVPHVGTNRDLPTYF